MIYLMRHGQDDESYIGGWSDVSLIPEGKLEVNETAKWIKDNLNIKKIICSDVKRAVETSEIVNKYLNVDVSFDANLREQSKGILNGAKRDDIWDDYGDLLENADEDTIYPGGDSLRTLYERMKVYLGMLVNLEDDTLLITHRGVINMLYYILNDIPLDFDKKRFGVDTASVHELDCKKLSIRKVR